VKPNIATVALAALAAVFLFVRYAWGHRGHHGDCGVGDRGAGVLLFGLARIELRGVGIGTLTTSTGETGIKVMVFPA
jgi:hypothetical protein